MAGDAGELYFTLNMRENIIKRGTEVTRMMSEMQGSIDKVTKSLVKLYTTTDEDGSEIFDDKGFRKVTRAGVEYVKQTGNIRKEVTELWSIYRQQQTLNLDTSAAQEQLSRLFGMLKQLRTYMLDPEQFKRLGMLRKQLEIFAKSYDTFMALGDTANADISLGKVKKVLAEINQLTPKASPEFLEVFKVGIAEVTARARVMKKELEEVVKSTKVANQSAVKMDIANGNDDVVAKLKEQLSVYETLKKSETDRLKRLAEISARLLEMKEKGVYPVKEREALLAEEKELQGKAMSSSDFISLSNKIENLKAAIKSVEESSKKVRQYLGDPHIEESFGAAGMAAQKHAQRQRELTEVFEAHFQQVEKEKKAQDELNAKLHETDRVLAAISKTKDDTYSQAHIANIRNQKAESDALIKKLNALRELEKRINDERAGIASGAITDPTYTKERVTAELAAIQRRYNKDLAQGKELERQDAEAKQRAAESTRRLQEANKGLMNAYEKVTQSARQTMNTLSMLRQQAGYYFSLFGAQTLLRNIITIGGQFEFQHVALQNIIGDAEKATTIFAQLKDLAVESPKTFMELTSSARQLSAYQIPANELFDTTKRLSDLSVGLGVDVNRLILAYGQVRSAAVLRGQELRQFTEAGIPMVQALAQKFTEMNGKLTTTADVFKLISQRAVSFEMVKEVLWDMTSQGGQFYNMQEEMADTLYGKWQKLQDIWQITLGDIADADRLSGKFFKTALDGVIFLARNLQSFVPLLATFGMYKAGDAIRNRFFGGMGKIDANIAKAQKLNAIELRRKLINGEIDQEMYQQAMHLNGQKEQYYSLLAMEGKITDKKLAQLAIDGETNKLLAYRILLQKGYTKEQLRMAGLGSKEKLPTGASPGKGLAGVGAGIGSSIWGFLGGWPGVVAMGLGSVFSIISAIDAKAEELHEKGKIMSTSAQEGANELLGTLKQVEGSNDTTEKKIETLEEALINMGATGSAIAAKSRENMDDINERWKTLKESAENYQKVLQFMGTSEGQALYEKSIEDSNIEKNINEYEKAESAASKQTANLQRFRTTYKEMVESIKESNKTLAKELEGKTLFEQLRIIPQKTAEAYLNQQREHLKGTEDYGSSRWGMALESLKAYNHLLGVSKREWNEIAEESIPKMKDELLAMAEHMHINVNDMSKANKDALESLVRNYVDKFENASVETKNKLAETLASQVFNIKIVGTLSLDTTKLSGYANFIWDKFGGGLSNDGTITIGNTKLSKEQVSNMFSSPDAFEKQARSDYDSAKKNYNTLKNTRDVTKSMLDEAQKTMDDKKAIWDAIRTDPIEDNKKTGGRTGGGGSKTDAFAKAMRERVSVLKDAYSEYKKWSEMIGKDAALAKVKNSGIFATLFADKGFLGLDDYEGELKRIRGMLKVGKPEQRKVAQDIDKMLLGMDFDKEKEHLEKAVTLMKDAIARIAKQWDNYKAIYDKTGDKGLASLVFSDGILWDEKSRAMADELRKSVSRGIDYSMSDDEARDFFNYNSVKGKALYEQWKQIVELIRGNYIKSLQDTADAQEKLANTAQKIAIIEGKIAELRRQGASVNDPRIIQLEKERGELEAKRFEETTSYLRFYSSILSMTVDEAERIGVSIKKNLVEQLAKGNINADKFLKSMKNVDAQLEKSRGRLFGGSDLGTFLQGGQKGLVDKRYEELASVAIELEQAREKLLQARISGTEADQLRAKIEMGTIIGRMNAIKEELKISQEQYKVLSDISSISKMVIGTLEGMQQAAQSLSDMFAATGHDNPANTWSDIADSIAIVTDTLKPIDGILQNLLNGNISGAMSNALLAPVNLFTSPISGIAKLHDKKLDRAIQRSQSRVKELENEYKNLEQQIERALGGIYTAGGYDEMIENYRKQLEELREQREDEARKKDTDAEKMLDYDQKIKEMEDSLDHYAEDMAKSLYDIDFKSWAEQLTDAVVGAWQNGEDAVEAWHDKVVDLVQDITKNVISQKIVETALQPVLDYVTRQMTAKSGKLDENDIVQMAKLLDAAGESSVSTITSLLDAMEAAGYDMKDGKSSGSSAKSTISSITEDTGNLLLSYVNAIRADVSMNREQLAQITVLMQAVPGLSAAAEMQLQQLHMIVDNTGRNADSAAAIESFCKGLRDGSYSIKVK